MTVSVLVPYRAGCAWRDRAWAWLKPRYAPFEVIEGASPPGPFSRTAAILDAARHATGDVFVIPDADIIIDDLGDAIHHAQLVGWAIPHDLLHRLSPESTELVYAGHDWRGLPLSTDNRQDGKPYRGLQGGTLMVVTRDAFHEAPPDPRFVGWGQEDQAWSAALRTLVGQPWRGDADIVHLWHPAQPRRSRAVGSPEGAALARRYSRAAKKPAVMRALIDEGREVACR